MGLGDDLRDLFEITCQITMYFLVQSKDVSVALSTRNFLNRSRSFQKQFGIAYQDLGN